MTHSTHGAWLDPETGRRSAAEVPLPLFDIQASGERAEAVSSGTVPSHTAGQDAGEPKAKTSPDNFSTLSADLAQVPEKAWLAHATGKEHSTGNREVAELGRPQSAERVDKDSCGSTEGRAPSTGNPLSKDAALVVMAGNDSEGRLKSLHGIYCPSGYQAPPAGMTFDGPDYNHSLDQARLTGQILRIYNLMRDGRWRTLSEIAQATGDPQASISAQLRNLRKARFGSHTVSKRRRGEAERGLFEYRMEER